MAYNRSIPQPTDLISNSQSQLLGNFQVIDSGTTGTGVGFARNHITMTDATNGGLHNRVDYYQAVASPAIVGFTSSAYAKTVNAISEFFYKNGTTDSQITSSSLNPASGEGFLPGGLQIRCAVGSASIAGVVNTFSTAFPTGCVSVVACADTSGNQVNVTAKSSASVTVKSPAGNCSIYYIAIGY